MEEAEGSTQLFAVFVLSLASLVLVPYTLNSLLGGNDGDGKDGKEVRVVDEMFEFSSVQLKL